jgi:FlaG/FlaF family flagellin (archaellin)
MVKALLAKAEEIVMKFLKDRKGDHNLLSTIGMVAIVVGVLAVISPTFRTSIVNMVQHALDYASNFFSNAVQGK